jgi:5'-nucleotidase
MPKKIHKILLSNDDGLLAPGLQTLFLALRSEGYEVVAVAPEGEQSTSGHSLTLHKPLYLYETQENQYAVTGTPADCVYIGTTEVFSAKDRPDLIISGINRGANLANDVYYSGTVAAAREGFLAGFPTIAVSLNILRGTRTGIERVHHHYEAASDIVLKLLKRFVPIALDAYSRFLWNVNVPDLPLDQIQGLRFSPLGERHYSRETLVRKDPRGRTYLWIAGELKGHNKEEDSDCSAVENNYVSVTPLQIDCSNKSELEFLQNILGRLGKESLNSG